MKFFLFFCSVLPAITALAQTENTVELAPLTISGNPFDSRLPSFSTSTTRLDSESLQERQALHLEDSLGMVPNLNFAGATSRPRYLQLRGVGERSQFSGEGPPNFSVGVLMDDIDLSGLAGGVTLFDVEQIDILRGPQATQYGSRALAGLMIVQSTPPSPLQDSLLRFSIGSDDLIEVGFASGGPVNENSDTLLYRFSLNMFRQNGHRDNVFLDRENTNRKQEFHGRFQLLWTPDDEQQHHLTFLAVRLNNGYDAFANVGDGFTMFTDEPGNDTLTLFGASLRSEYQSPEPFDLIAITSVTHADSGYGYDADWGNDAFWAAAPYNFDPETEGYRNAFTEQLDRTRNQIGQEIRFQSKANEGLWNGRSAWSSGLVFTWLNEEDDYVGFSALESEYEAVTLGGYLQLTTQLSENLDLITSIRSENRSSEYSDSEGVSEDTSDWMNGGRIALEFSSSVDTHWFTGLGRGFKGGGVNANPALTRDQRIYDPEHVWNLEGGVRREWSEGRGQASFTLFHMWREDLQIGTSIQPDPSDPTSFTYFTDNAAEGTNYGAEMDLRTPLTEAITFFASLGLLETEYKNFKDAGGNVNIDGREQPHAPRYTFRTGVLVDLSEHWFAKVEVEGKDSFYFSDSHDLQSDPYELVHLSLGYQTESWSLTLWGRNILDKDYDIRGYYFGLEPPDYPARLWTMKGDPAQVGLTFQTRW
jgi:outer membrane receptor protein involved in Fe transport